MVVQLENLIQMAIQERASDIHLRFEEKPIFRIDGTIRVLEMPVLTQEDLEIYVKALVPERLFAGLKISKELDFAYEPEIEGQKIRLRANVFFAQGNYGIVLRLVQEKPLQLGELGFPDYPLQKIKELLHSPRGLLLVVGPTGSGKSTTLAAMIDYINENCNKHIITIEDPVEYIYQRKRCIITQRELGRDTASFQKALSGALRQDPDVILVGEMRDLATIEAAVSAAETGHLVLSTLHTTGSSRTVDRIIDAFPEGSKDLVRTQLASNLIGVISQVLCKKKDGVGRIPAFEIMMHSDSVANLIRENKVFRIQTELETNQRLGMLPLDKHLFELWQEGKITQDEALSKALLAKELEARMQANPLKKKGLFSF